MNDHMSTEGGAKAGDDFNRAGERATEAMSGLEAYLAPLFQNLPHIPEGGRKFLVDFAPWVALIFGILGVVSLAGAGGISFLLTIGTFGFALPLLIAVLLGLIAAVLLLAAFPGLKARTKAGWNKVFYSQVVSIVSGVVSMFFGGASGLVSGFVGTLIGALIGFYILFEIRSWYNK
jgi:hypothetical protein